MTKQSVPPLLIPVRKYRKLSGTFTWPAKTVLASCRDADTLPLEQLNDDLRQLKIKSKTVNFSIVNVNFAPIFDSE